MRRTVVLLAAAFLSAPAPAAGPVKIGLMAPLTGSWASEGLEMRRTVELLADGVNAAIGNQIAGKSSATAPGTQALTLAAVRTSDSTGVCQAALGGAQTVSMAYECISPATCAASAFQMRSCSSVSGMATSCRCDHLMPRPAWEPGRAPWQRRAGCNVPGAAAEHRDAGGVGPGPAVLPPSSGIIHARFAPSSDRARSRPRRRALRDGLFALPGEEAA